MENVKEPWGKRFCLFALMRSLVCYTVCSLAEIGLMTMRTSEETQVLVGLASDLLGKLAILLLASLIFGFSFVFFRLRMPSAAKRFLHIVTLFVPIVMVSQSLVGDATLDMQAYVAYYFFAVLVYLAIYGISMIVSSAVRKHFGASFR